MLKTLYDQEKFKLFKACNINSKWIYSPLEGLIMTTVLLTIHILISIAIVGLVLMQRSEGGGLGIGGGNNFMSARGTADLLTRATTFLAIAFFCTSILLAILAGYGKKTVSIVEEVSQESSSEVNNLNDLQPSVPTDN